jgi:hypothetical protein
MVYGGKVARWRGKEKREESSRAVKQSGGRRRPTGNSAMACDAIACAVPVCSFLLCSFYYINLKRILHSNQSLELALCEALA